MIASYQSMTMGKSDMHYVVPASIIPTAIVAEELTLSLATFHGEEPKPFPMIVYT
jgi:hypothetical protein